MKYLKNIQWRKLKEDLMKIPLKTILMTVVAVGLVCAFSQPVHAVSCGDWIMPSEPECEDVVVTLTEDMLDCDVGLYVMNEACPQGETPSSVTIDCAGHTIAGSPPEIGLGDIGILIDTATNITVKNCNFKWYQEGGVKVSAGENIVLENNTVKESSIGFNFNGAFGMTATGNVMADNLKDIREEYCSDCELYNNILTSSKVFNYGSSPPNTWSVASPYSGRNIAGGDMIGGNFWLDQPCSGIDPNFCADPVTLADGGVDYYPLRKVEVTDPTEAVAQLAAVVAEVNAKAGILNALDVKLDAALNALEDAVVNNDGAASNALNAFINHCEAQSGNKISQEDANKLITDAMAIIELLNAP